MTGVVDKLWELQTELSRLAEREKSLNTKPEAFAEIDRELMQSDSQIRELEQRIDKLKDERREAEGELQDEQEVLKKYQGQLMQVKNQQQYAAAWKEIDSSRKKVKEFEDQLLRQMADSEELQRLLEAKRGPHGELKATWDMEYELWQSSLGTLREEAAAIRLAVSRIESEIPQKVRDDFNRIFKQRQGVAVTRVINESCGACRVRIRPQASQQLKRGELVACEGCKRIFYLERTAS